MAIEVIGPAFGRTGTMSFKAALELLGYGPCYHMSEVYERNHIDAWTRVINGEPLDVAAMFAGFRSVVDWPASSYWKDVWAANPAARIVLTRRDPDQWFDSIEQTIFVALRSASEDEARMRWRVQTRQLILERTFGNDLTREHCLEVLRAHEADVVASVPREQLLVFEVADGWEPLCAFLDAPVPAEPFPRSNSTAEFRTWTGLEDPARER